MWIEIATILLWIAGFTHKGSGWKGWLLKIAFILCAAYGTMISIHMEVHAARNAIQARI